MITFMRRTLAQTTIIALSVMQIKGSRLGFNYIKVAYLHTQDKIITIIPL